MINNRYLYETVCYRKSLNIILSNITIRSNLVICGVMSRTLPHGNNLIRKVICLYTDDKTNQE